MTLIQYKFESYNLVSTVSLIFYFRKMTLDYAQLLTYWIRDWVGLSFWMECFLFQVKLELAINLVKLLMIECMNSYDIREFLT